MVPLEGLCFTLSFLLTSEPREILASYKLLIKMEEGRGGEGAGYPKWGYHLRDAEAGQHTVWFPSPQPERPGWEVPAFESPVSVPGTPWGKCSLS